MLWRIARGKLREERAVMTTAVMTTLAGLTDRPRLLVADEPTGALDSAAGEEVLGALDRISADGTTIMLVTHDLGVAERAHRLITMADGRITGTGGARTGEIGGIRSVAAPDPPRDEALR